MVVVVVVMAWALAAIVDVIVSCVTKGFTCNTVLDSCSHVNEVGEAPSFEKLFALEISWFSTCYFA